jgi:hypothetical protein
MPAVTIPLPHDQPDFCMKLFWENCQEIILEEMTSTYHLRKQENKPYRVSEAMRTIIEDDGRRLLTTELTKAKISERSAIIRFTAELMDNVFKKGAFTMRLIPREASLMKDAHRQSVPHIIVTKSIPSQSVQRREITHTKEHVMTNTTTPPPSDASDEGVLNAARIARGNKIISDYAASQNGRDDDTSLTDVLTDLRHAAASRGLSFDDCLGTSEEFFEEEKEEGPWSE